MDLPAVTGALAGVNTAFSLLKTALSTSNKVQLNEAVSKMSEALLEARTAALTFQEAEFAYKQEIRELKDRVEKLTRQAADKENYVLTDLGSGAFVFAYKPAVESGEPPHWLCVPCLNNNKKSVLQISRRDIRDHSKSIHACPACKTEVKAHYTRKPGAEVTAD